MNLEKGTMYNVARRQRQARRKVHFLLLYIFIITVAVVGLSISNYKKAQEIKQICGLDSVVCPGEKVEPIKPAEPISMTEASWYDYDLNGLPWSESHRTTASREFERGTMVRVTNVENGKSVDVLVNDYGPELCPEDKPNCEWADRDLDLSSFAFAQIADLQDGTVKVEYQKIGQGEYRPLVKR